MEKFFASYRKFLGQSFASLQGIRYPIAQANDSVRKRLGFLEFK